MSALWLLLLAATSSHVCCSRILHQQEPQSLAIALTEVVKAAVAPNAPDLLSVDWQALVNSIQAAPAYDGPTRLVLPVRAALNTQDCAKVTSTLQEASAFQSAIRFALSVALGLEGVDRVNVTQIACNDQGVVLDLDVLLDDTTSDDEVRRVVEQITQAALLPVQFLSALNIQDFTLSSPITLGNIPALGDPRQYLPALPSLDSIPTVWNEITSAALQLFNGNLRVQLPFQLSLPWTCRIVAPTQEGLQTFKEDLQATISKLLSLADASRVSINTVTCSANSSSIINLSVLADDMTSIPEIASLYNQARSLAAQVQEALNDKYTADVASIPEVTQAAFNWTQSLLQQLTEPVKAIVGQVQASIPARLSFDADCATVLASIESSNQFKAAAQLALSVGLNIPTDRIDITSVACGSLVMDLTMLVDSTTSNEQVQAAVKQLNTDASTIFPPELKTLMGVTSVSGKATSNLAQDPTGPATAPIVSQPFSASPGPAPAAVKLAGARVSANLVLLTLAGVLSLLMAM